MRKTILRWAFWASFMLLPLLLACEPLNSGGGDAGNVPVGQAAQQVATATPIPTAPAVARPTYTVERGTVQNTLEFTGRWQPRDQIQLSFEISGTIRQVNVQRGDQVAVGQLLADMQITDLENQLANAELDLETAQRNLESSSSSSSNSVADAEIALANARLTYQNSVDSSPWTNVESARINLEEAQRQLEEAEFEYDEALSRPIEDAQQVDQALVTVNNARDSVRKAQNSYYSAAQDFNNHEYNIGQNYNNLLKAERELENARNGVGSDVSQEQAVRSSQLNIDQIKGQIAQSSLYSPIDGTVLEVTIQPGNSVEAFNAVMTVGIPEPLEAIASIPITDAQDLAVGLVGVCNVINQPETAVQCVVRQIPASSQDADQTTRVAASLENVPSGQLIEVEMPLEVREDVLWLPPAAIRTFQNRTFVVLETSDGPRSVDVQIGLQTDDRVEIIAGLNEGDVVEGP